MIRLTTQTGRLLLGAGMAVYLLSGCKKKKEEDHSHSSTPMGDSTWVEVMHEHTPNQSVHVYVYALLHKNQNGQVREGHNRFRIRVEGYTGTNVKLLPMMYMQSMTHSCPTKQPDGKAPDGYFYAEAFFMMPTTVVNGTVTEPWKLHVIVENDTVTAEIRVNPHPNGWVRRKSFMGGSLRLMYEFRPEVAWKVGNVPVSVYLYRRDMNHPHERPEGFPPAVDRVHAVQLSTWMPSMGHGASGNEPAHPVSGTFGQYRGQVGFNMTGDWDIYLAFVEQQSQGGSTRTDTLGMDTIRVQF